MVQKRPPRPSNTPSALARQFSFFRVDSHGHSYTIRYSERGGRAGTPIGSNLRDKNKPHRPSRSPWRGERIMRDTDPVPQEEPPVTADVESLTQQLLAPFESSEVKFKPAVVTGN